MNFRSFGKPLADTKLRPKPCLWPLLYNKLASDSSNHGSVPASATAEAVQREENYWPVPAAAYTIPAAVQCTVTILPLLL